MGTTKFEKLCGDASRNMQRLQVIADDLDEGLTLLTSKGKPTNDDIDLISSFIRLLSESKSLLAQLEHTIIPSLENEDKTIASAIKIGVTGLSTRIENAKSDLDHYGSLMNDRNSSHLRLVG